MKNFDFNSINEQLTNGQLTTATKATDEQYIVRDSKDDNGKLTGFREVVAKGGKVNFEVHENILLNGIQRLVVSKGMFEFGRRIFNVMNESSIEEIQAKFAQYGIESKKVNAIFRKYCNAIGFKGANFTTEQAIEAIQSICVSQLEKANSVKTVTTDDKSPLVAYVNEHNRIHAERITLALKGSQAESEPQAEANSATV